MRPEKREGTSKRGSNGVPGRGFSKREGLEVGTCGWKSTVEIKFKSRVFGSHVFSTWGCFCLDVPSHYVLLMYYLIFLNQTWVDSEPRL